MDGVGVARHIIEFPGRHDPLQIRQNFRNFIKNRPMRLPEFNMDRIGNIDRPLDPMRFRDLLIDAAENFPEIDPSEIIFDFVEYDIANQFENVEFYQFIEDPLVKDVLLENPSIIEYFGNLLENDTDISVETIIDGLNLNHIFENATPEQLLLEFKEHNVKQIVEDDIPRIEPDPVFEDPVVDNMDLLEILQTRNVSYLDYIRSLSSYEEKVSVADEYATIAKTDPSKYRQIVDFEPPVEDFEPPVEDIGIIEDIDVLAPIDVDFEYDLEINLNRDAIELDEELDGGEMDLFFEEADGIFLDEAAAGAELFIAAQIGLTFGVGVFQAASVVVSIWDAIDRQREADRQEKVDIMNANSCYRRLQAIEQKYEHQIHMALRYLKAPPLKQSDEILHALGDKYVDRKFRATMYWHYGPVIFSYLKLRHDLKYRKQNPIDIKTDIQTSCDTIATMWRKYMRPSPLVIVENQRYQPRFFSKDIPRWYNDNYAKSFKEEFSDYVWSVTIGELMWEYNELLRLRTDEEAFRKEYTAFVLKEYLDEAKKDARTKYIEKHDPRTIVQNLESIHTTDLMATMLAMQNRTHDVHIHDMTISKDETIEKIHNVLHLSQDLIKKHVQSLFNFLNTVIKRTKPMTLYSRESLALVNVEHQTDIELDSEWTTSNMNNTIQAKYPFTESSRQTLEIWPFANHGHGVSYFTKSVDGKIHVILGMKDAGCVFVSQIRPHHTGVISVTMYAHKKGAVNGETLKIDDVHKPQITRLFSEMTGYAKHVNLDNAFQKPITANKHLIHFLENKDENFEFTSSSTNHEVLYTNTNKTYTIVKQRTDKKIVQISKQHAQEPRVRPVPVVVPSPSKKTVVVPKKSETMGDLAFHYFSLDGQPEKQKMICAKLTNERQHMPDNNIDITLRRMMEICDEDAIKMTKFVTKTITIKKIAEIAVDTVNNPDPVKSIVGPGGEANTTIVEDPETIKLLNSVHTSPRPSITERIKTNVYFPTIEQVQCFVTKTKYCTAIILVDPLSKTVSFLANYNKKIFAMTYSMMLMPVIYVSMYDPQQGKYTKQVLTATLNIATNMLGSVKYATTQIVNGITSIISSPVASQAVISSKNGIYWIYKDNTWVKVIYTAAGVYVTVPQSRPYLNAAGNYAKRKMYDIIGSGPLLLMGVLPLLPLIVRVISDTTEPTTKKRKLKK